MSSQRKNYNEKRVLAQLFNHITRPFYYLHKQRLILKIQYQELMLNTQKYKYLNR